MPKVSPEYLENKKESIFQAAAAILRKKPLYDVTMKDIIREIGISQGGIYRYFSNVDEILVEVINRCSPVSDYRREIDGIIEKSKSPEEAVESLFSYIGEYMRSGTEITGKILYELTVLMASHPERGRNIQSQIKDGQIGQYFIEKISVVIREGVRSGCFHPVVPADDILSYISIAIDGIAVDEALLISYGVPQRGEIPFDMIRLMETFRTAVLLMLNGREKDE